MKLSAVGASFHARADSAAFFEAWVGSVLARAGLYTLHHPFTVADNVKDVHLYAHTWDLEVGTNPDTERGDMEPVEVKSLKQAFSGVSDYPFDSLLVCSQKNWLKKWPGAGTTRRNFLFVSRQTGSIIWLPIGSKVELGHDVVDTSRNELYKAVRASMSDAKDLYDFVEYVRRMQQ